MYDLAINLMLLPAPGWLYVIAILFLTLLATSAFSRIIRAASYFLAATAATCLYFSAFHDLSNTEVEKLRSKGLLTDCVIEKTINSLNDQEQYLPIAGRLTYQKIQAARLSCDLPTDKKTIIKKLKSSSVEGTRL